MLDSVRTPFPIALQGRAVAARRRHVWRGFARAAVLLAVDCGILLLLREMWRGVRDSGWLGTDPAGLASSLVPQGSFPNGELLAGVVIGLLVLGNYGAGDHRRDPSTITAGAMLGLALLYWRRLWGGDFHWTDAAAFALAVSTLAVALVIGRSLVDILVRRFRPTGTHAARAVLVGAPSAARAALEHPALSDPAEFRVAGYVSHTSDVPPDALGSTRDLVWILVEHHIDTVVFAGDLPEGAFTSLLDVVDSAGCAVYSLPLPVTVPTFEPQLVWRRGAPLVQLNRPALHGQQLVAKRAFDVVTSLLGLVLLSPLFLLIAAAVRATSRGPVLFRQLRVGVGGRHFYIYKFRSMVHDAERLRDELAAQSMYADARLFKLRADPRCTRLGIFLRRTSLDELPQLWNVLRGEMSLVGPRPPVPGEVAHYEERHYSRFDMKPGITGPWQVAGRNQITDFDEVIRLESQYMRRWTIWKDFAILLRTIPVVLRMNGAH